MHADLVEGPGAPRIQAPDPNPAGVRVDRDGDVRPVRVLHLTDDDQAHRRSVPDFPPGRLVAGHVDRQHAAAGFAPAFGSQDEPADAMSRAKIESWMVAFAVREGALYDSRVLGFRGRWNRQYE